MSGVPIMVSADAELIRISVRDGKLFMPKENGKYKEHTIYYNDPARGPATPGRPTEVVWLAFGLSRNQSVKIEAKGPSRGKGCMARDDHGPLITGNNPLYSGKAINGPVVWSYSVTLFDDNARQLDTIDPDVNIVIDP